VRSTLNLLSVHDFRCYSRADLPLDGRSAFIFGPNGAGKTNLLEAASLLSPGKGLRGASFAELARRTESDGATRPWAISARVAVADREITIGSGSEGAQAGRRVVRVDGETASPAAMVEWIRPIWLSPAQDRVFLDAAGDRRRFFDRLVFSGEPSHAKSVAIYDRALRERIRLLTEGGADPGWLSALESRMAKSGALIAAARSRTLAALQAEIDGRGEGPFPKADLTLTGRSERLSVAGEAVEEIEEHLVATLAHGRAHDAAAGRTLEGPHRGDLLVVHRQKRRPAAECSTGEQKALILNLILAQAARLSRAKSLPNPILLLDEVAAHLDSLRRAALFDEIEALSLQALLTGTDETLFQSLRGRWVGVHVAASELTVMEVQQ